MKNLSALLLFAQTACFAANWLELRNTEQQGADSFRFWGFIQPQYVHVETKPLSGVTAPATLAAYNGSNALFNMASVKTDSANSFYIFRARPSVRGVVPETDGKINYFLMAEGGYNALSATRGAVITDATVTLNYIPGARIRLGLGGVPFGEEAFQGIQALNYINFTNATDLLLNERFAKPYKTSRPTSPPLGTSLVMSSTVYPVSAFQDVGAELFDWFRDGNMEYSYALLLGRGNGINYNGSGRGAELSGRLQAAYIVDGKGVARDDIMAYIWRQGGKREFGGSEYERVREGAGFKYQVSPLRISGEYIRAKGMIFAGPTPPFNDAGGAAMEPVTMFALDKSNKASGFYLDAGYKVTPKVELDVRYDELNRLTNSAFDERKLSTTTLGCQYFFDKKLKLTVDYEIRKIKVSNPNAAGSVGAAAQQQTQLKDGALIADSIGNRFTAQFTYIF